MKDTSRGWFPMPWSLIQQPAPPVPNGKQYRIDGVSPTVAMGILMRLFWRDIKPEVQTVLQPLVEGAVGYSIAAAVQLILAGADDSRRIPNAAPVNGHIVLGGPVSRVRWSGWIGSDLIEGRWLEVFWRHNGACNIVWQTGTDELDFSLVQIIARSMDGPTYWSTTSREEAVDMIDSVAVKIGTYVVDETEKVPALS